MKLIELEKVRRWLLDYESKGDTIFSITYKHDYVADDHVYKFNVYTKKNKEYATWFVNSKTGETEEIMCGFHVQEIACEVSELILNAGLDTMLRICGEIVHEDAIKRIVKEFKIPVGRFEYDL